MEKHLTNFSPRKKMRTCKTGSKSVTIDVTAYLPEFKALTTDRIICMAFENFVIQKFQMQRQEMSGKMSQAVQKEFNTRFSVLDNLIKNGITEPNLLGDITGLSVQSVTHYLQTGEKKYIHPSAEERNVPEDIPVEEAIGEDISDSPKK